MKCTKIHLSLNIDFVEYLYVCVWLGHLIYAVINSISRLFQPCVWWLIHNDKFLGAGHLITGEGLGIKKMLPSFADKKCDPIFSGKMVCLPMKTFVVTKVKKRFVSHCQGKLCLFSQTH